MLTKKYILEPDGTERMIVAEGRVLKTYLGWPFGDVMNSVKVGSDTF